MDGQVSDQRHRKPNNCRQAAHPPTNSFGSKPAVRFDGTNDFLNISSLRADNGAYSAYAAVRRADQSGITVAT